jgi:hypothetical protein
MNVLGAFILGLAIGGAAAAIIVCVEAMKCIDRVASEHQKIQAERKALDKKLNGVH